MIEADQFEVSKKHRNCKIFPGNPLFFEALNDIE